VTAGQTYYVQVGGISTDAGQVQVTIDLVDPPANDHFANATVISSLPFSDAADGVTASGQTGEPSGPCGSFPTGTVWYRYTPSSNTTLTASTPSSGVVIAVYTGSSLATLVPVPLTICANIGNPSVFNAVAGTTYYFQVRTNGGRPPLAFNLASS
jgi:hypothetical protein